MPQIRPITDLRNTTEISELCHSSQEPIFITKNGYGDLVVMSMEMYDALLHSEWVDSAISRAEQEISEGKPLLDAREALAALRRKYLGEL